MTLGRGVPVMKPTFEEFASFSQFIEKISPIGFAYGLVKVAYDFIEMTKAEMRKDENERVGMKARLEDDRSAQKEGY